MAMRKAKAKTPAPEGARERILVWLDKKMITQLILDFLLRVKEPKQFKPFLDDYFDRLWLREVRR